MAFVPTGRIQPWLVIKRSVTSGESQVDSQTETTNQNAPRSGDQDNNGARKQYTPPQLISHGELRSLTLGGSPGSGDSGVSNEDPQSGSGRR